MTAAKASAKKDGETPELVSYRLLLVENAVRDLGVKFEKQDNIKKSDLTEFRDTLITRITDIKTDIQRQIDEKADKTELGDLKKLVYGFATFLSTLVGGFILFYLTHK